MGIEACLSVSLESSVPYAPELCAEVTKVIVELP